MSALARFLTLNALLFALVGIPASVAMAQECPWGTILIRDMTQCEWQQARPIPGNEHVCEPLTLIGTNSADRLNGGDVGDVIIGKKGNDVLRGWSGNDVLRGGQGRDKLDGGWGDDDLHGGRGRDQLDGGQGNDDLHGGRGNDQLDGGHGNDELRSGEGDDNLTGGPGDDRFVFTIMAKGDKIITDFEPGPCENDRIVLSGFRASQWPTVAEILASEIHEPDGYNVYTLRPGLTVETDVPLEASDFVTEY